MQYFGSNIVEGVAESWVEAKMSWVEVDGAGWRGVHGLVIPIFFQAPSVVVLIVLKLNKRNSERFNNCD